MPRRSNTPKAAMSVAQAREAASLPSVPEALTPDALLMIQTIAHHGSFARAAQDLGRVPSAITYAVRRLEDSLDVLLFDRSGHRAKLTPAGQTLLSEGQRLLTQMDDIACRVRRVATGWEAQITIAVDEIVPMEPILELTKLFLSQQNNTQVRLTREVLGGTWDALVSGRADLAIGASYDAPPVAGFKAVAMGTVEFVFAVAPGHPLARAAEPLDPVEVTKHRVVVIADTSRNMSPRTVGVLNGQPILTVATGQDKVLAQLSGMGCGYLPRSVAEPLAKKGRLVLKQFESRPGIQAQAMTSYAWRSGETGRALEWFIAKLEESHLRAALLYPPWGNGIG